jgi:hypothetical protein
VGREVRPGNGALSSYLSFGSGLYSIATLGGADEPWQHLAILTSPPVLGMPRQLSAEAPAAPTGNLSSKMSFICSQCGEPHDGLPTDSAFKLPDEVWAIPEPERSSKAKFTSEELGVKRVFPSKK